MEIINQGTLLMLYGIGTVFVFLCTLILTMTAMSFVLNRYFAEAVTEPALVQANKSTAITAQRLEILQLAINQHRDRQTR